MSTYQNFQASIFGDFSMIDPANKKIQKLYNSFMNEKMFPSTRPAVNMAIQQIVNRPMFQNDIGTMVVSIGMDRIDVNAQAPSKEMLIQKEDFIQKSIKYFEFITNVFTNIKMTRISLITNSLLKFVPDIKKDYFTNTFLEKFPTFDDKTIKEWSVNTVTSENWLLHDKSENVNINITAHLQVFNVIKDGELVHRNGLLLTKDLNTFGDRLAPRFDIDDIKIFLDKAGDADGRVEDLFRKSESRN